MKTYKTLTVGIILMAVIMMDLGCQPSQAKSEKENQDIQTPVQSSQEAKTEPTRSAGAAAQKGIELPETEKTPSPATVQENQDAPAVTVKNPVHDLGQVGPSTSHKFEYTFTNTGKALLKIQRVQSTCGCTVPELQKKEYEPGESGTIKVTFKAPSTKGSVTKHLYIVSNDPKTPRAELEIKCQVVVMVSASPESVELRFDTDNAGMSDIVVKSEDDREFSVKSVTVGNQVMKIDFDPAQKATQFVLKPTVDMDRLNKYPTGAIQIKTDHPQSGTLLVRYKALEKYTISRPRIILQNVEPGKVIEKDVVIISNYGSPVEIASIESRNGYMEVTSQEKDGAGVKMVISITPPEQSASARRYITDELTIILKDDTKLSIRCSGWFRLR